MKDCCNGMSRAQLEARRLCGAELFRAGKRQIEVARHLGVTRTTTSRWFRAWQTGESLKARKTPGRPSRLNSEQQKEIRSMYRRNLSTAKLAEAIHERFGVRYSADHVCRILHRLGIWKNRRRALPQAREVEVTQ